MARRRELVGAAAHLDDREPPLRIARLRQHAREVADEAVVAERGAVERGEQRARGVARVVRGRALVVLELVEERVDRAARLGLLDRARERRVGARDRGQHAASAAVAGSDAPNMAASSGLAPAASPSWLPGGASNSSTSWPVASGPSPSWRDAPMSAAIAGSVLASVASSSGASSGASHVVSPVDGLNQ